MKHLLHTLEGRLVTLPVPMAVALPAGPTWARPTRLWCCAFGTAWRWSR